jgi:hypothetical protein
MPLTPEILERIERLHAESDAREERMLTVPRNVAASARRYLIWMMSRLRGDASKISQTIG